jgi:uncharacterized membrane protein YhaH (DUF805 family)
MKKLLTTKGRISRSTFWKFFGCVYGLGLLIGIADDAAPFPDWAKGILVLLLLPVLFAAVIVQIKRWHDLNKSEWWVLINFIPVIGVLWSLKECGFQKGTQGANRFGPDPLETEQKPVQSAVS